MKMETELLKIYDQQGREIGTASRSEVHYSGLWHETFHCWFVEKDADDDFVLFQIRSALKKDYPSLLDITAAGHLLADECIFDGLREVKEELGIDLSFEELSFVGTIRETLVSSEFIDNELCHVYLYNKKLSPDLFSLQQEEVSGIVRARINDFERLWSGKKTEINVEGFQINKAGQRETLTKLVSKKDFAPHEDSYIYKVLQAMRKALT